MDLLLKHALSGKDLILSTGMSTIKEVESALGIIAYGFKFPQTAKSTSFKGEL